MDLFSHLQKAETSSLCRKADGQLTTRGAVAKDQVKEERGAKVDSVKA